MYVNRTNVRRTIMKDELGDLAIEEIISSLKITTKTLENKLCLLIIKAYINIQLYF